MDQNEKTGTIRLACGSEIHRMAEIPVTYKGKAVGVVDKIETIDHISRGFIGTVTLKITDPQTVKDILAAPKLSMGYSVEEK